MKNIVYFLVWLITNSIVAQVAITSKDILIMNDSIKLPGTLSYNKTIKQQPLVIFVQGSGNPDRNGNQLQMGIKANYIKQLADSLNQRNIAFYRFDKRNVTAENIKHILKKFEFLDLVNDVNAVIANFKDDKRFSSIVLLGHSQGALVTILAAKNNIDKYISLAGAGESIDKTIIKQVTAQNEEFGKITKQHIEELKSTGTIKEINPMLITLFAKQNHVFLSSYIKLDPIAEIKKLKIPILILNGTKDLQVKVDDATKLHNANPNSKLVIIENMNHVLKTITKDEDNLKSYYSPDYPLSKELINTIEAFIKK